MTEHTANERMKIFSLKLPSLALLFLCLFTISNYFSPLHYLGDQFSRAAYVTGLLATIFYIVRQITQGKPLFFFSTSLFFLLLTFLAAIYATFYETRHEANSFIFFDHFTKAIILYLLISQIVDSVNELIIFLMVLTVCSFGLAFQMVHFPIWEYGRAFIEGSNLTTDPNGLSAVFVYTLPIAFALFFIFPSFLFRIILAYIMFTLFLGIIEAQSRGAFLAILVSFTVLFLQIKKTKHRLLLITVILILVPIVLRYTTEGYIDRIMTIFQSVEDYTGSAKARSSNMLITFDYILSHPFSEFGLGNHSLLIADSLGVELPGPEEFKGNYLAHNMFLQFGADTGLVPLSFYLLFVLTTLYSLRVSKRRLDIFNGEHERTLKILVFAVKISLLTYLAAAFFLPWAYTFFLFYLSGICCSLNSITKRLGTQHNE